MTPGLFILGSAGVPACYGGFETLAENLADRLSADREVWVACSTHFYAEAERSPFYLGYRRFFINNRANGIASLLYDLRSLIYACRHSSRGDHILMLGIGSGVFLPFFALISPGKIYVHADGLEWKRGKWNRFAKTWLRFSRRLSVRFAYKIILDNEALLNFIPGKFRNKTRLISYGGDHLEELPELPAPVSEEYALVVARAEPENNLRLILDTFRELPERMLVLITNARDTPYGRSLIREFSAFENVRFIDAIYNQPELLHSYRVNCRVYLHGHSAGGTNPSLVEALCSGVPVLALDNAFNRNTGGEFVRYFKDRESLKKNVLELFDPDFKHPDEKQKEFARRHYSWDKVSEQFRSIL